MDFPLWFGSDDSPLFAMASVPDDDAASGAVVLCPPLGLEGVCVRRTFEALARALAERGIVALRIDYDGTGDSAGNGTEADRVRTWVRSVDRAVDLAYQSGAPKVAVVGMRLGATFAALALQSLDREAPRDLIDALVIWDPCSSGRSYLRAQRALQFFGVDESDQADGSIEGPGIVFDPETVAALRSIDLGAVTDALAERMLVLAREDQPYGKASLERFIAAHSGADLRIARGQERLVDVEPFAAEIPWADVEVVTTWLSDTLAGVRTEVSLPRRASVVVARSSSGSIVESFEPLGPLGLFGIITEPEAMAESSGCPTAIFLNAGVIDHTGPARLWVNLGRTWAKQGIRSVRCDLSGLGDSPPRPGQLPDDVYHPDALDDLVDIATAVSPADPSNVVLVGLCSGGYHAIEGALALNARGVCAVNPGFPSKPSELLTEDVATTTRPDARRQAASATRWWIRALPAHDQIGTLLNRMPDQVWWVLNRVAVERSPARVVQRLVDLGIRTLIVSGERETWFIWKGERRARRRLERSGRFRQVELAGIDHELFRRDARELVSQIVTADVIAAYAPIRQTVPPEGAEGR